MLALPLLPHALVPPTLAPAPSRAAAPRMETKADLVSLAPKLNPLVPFYDPLNLASMDLWGKGSEATIGWLRHSEIKHGRIAMFAFVGYCVQANGVHWPWQLTSAGLSFGDISAAGFPAEQWDALPTAAKLQILGAIGLLEYFGEGGAGTLGAHYTKGGKPGYFPPLKGSSSIPHPVPFNLYDPFGLSAGKTAEQKARGLVSEINNGRLAMIGIIGFLSASKVPGSVPALSGVIPSYAGEPMAPFSAVDSALPFVTPMLDAFKGAGWPALL
ncbi:hypothetical protein AB1Y20_022771 [Prymnesium parvum]|uniref:Chloroplast light harvesting protein n=1 Tax=Prymnesium parvum TaxID=97485 RepID=A0AB34JK05_PRYPA